MTDPDVRASIMRAVYEALCEHGYTELTAQDIADRTDKSKSLLFYHYDSKEDILGDFLEFLFERFDERVAETRDRPPVERLAVFVDWFLYGPEENDRQSFHVAMLELRTQAPYNETFREKLRKSDDQLRAVLEEILRDGLEAGEFNEHDPEETAALLIAAFDGARIRQLTIGRDEYLEQVRKGTATWVFDDLLAEDASFPADRDPSTLPESDQQHRLAADLGNDGNGDADESNDDEPTERDRE
ncbi:TetR/AcrR family transcriptional regulator [Natronococcus sp. A-GB1]|uniref:TetR/AcrR family transcriptional regulator n=1 Tax=Natronococcus sp. A-GB1 TaxID=3037648 RepID=UPI00241E5561|nr:TetR/AcrR family transcriptional regulator [Natronococcus sp. A-GB1]MDG5758822.1 TetR/AcrR family transcriptional regulator [Natronococcus sp. A-GB1]